MPEHLLSAEQSELYESDGFGISNNSDGTGIVKIFIHIRKDSMIPSFDALTDLKYFTEGLEEQQKLTASLIEMVTDGGGMFVEDILKLQERDVYSMAEEKMELGNTPPVIALHALKKAVCNYFEQTGQNDRYNKATEDVLCVCRHVTAADIEDLIQKGKTTYEEISKITGSGTGCGSCANKVKDFIDGKINTGLGKFA